MTPATSWRMRAVRSARIALLAVGVAASLGAAAQTGKPVRILVGFPAGGSADALARSLAEVMGKNLGQAFVVDNRPGAGGLIAAQALKSAEPDGNTLLLTNDHTVAILPHTLKNPGFDVAKDFAPVALVSQKGSIALAAHASTKITRLSEIPAWVRQNPGQANFGVPAPGSIPAFAVGLLGKALNIDASAAPYRGGAPMVADLTAGHVPFGVTSASDLLPHHNSQVRILAVSGTERHPELPDVPTFAELSIKGLDVYNAVGVYAPAKTPAAVITRYTEAVRTAMAAEQVKARFRVLGTAPGYGDAAALTQTMQRISDAMGPVIRQSGFQPQ
ncbi:tripartite tricarboxylate transporter substrate-binding protein [Variovorax sp. LARHSF232]